MASAKKRPSKTQDNLVYGLVWLACFAPLLWLAWRGFMGELGATADWRGICEELWPFVDGPPRTALGEQEASWAAGRAAAPASS